jgi:large subunit ribosomal protein L23
MPSVELIKKLYSSEKAQSLSKENKYVFLVDRKANKSELKKAVEKKYKVKALSINIISGKAKKSPKKAVVTLKKGQTINE